MLATAAYAQEAFDAEKTKALFAGTEWVSYWAGWRSEITFAADGTMTVKVSGEYSNTADNRVVRWTPTGPRSVKDDKHEWIIAPDGKEMYPIKEKGSFNAYHRGKKYPPEFPFLRATLAKPGIVWVEQGKNKRITFAFNGEMGVVWGVDGVEKYQWHSTSQSFGGGQFYFRKEAPLEHFMFYLIQDERGGRFLRDGWSGAIYKPEPAQPGDPVPPNVISRASSPFGGTSWCRPDGKGKVLTLTFAANGTVSDSSFPNEKPEWDPYDDGSIRYKVKDGTRKMKLSEDKKLLVREDSKRREIWFAGRQPPRVSMTEEKQLKSTLADKDKAWVNWDDGKKTVYLFNDKTADVTISLDDIKLKTVRWESLCAGCIRIGDEVFMVEGETLERVEPRLTLKQVARDSIR